MEKQLWIKEEKLERLIQALQRLATDCEIPATIQPLGVPQNVFTENPQRGGRAIPASS